MNVARHLLLVFLFVFVNYARADINGYLIDNGDGTYTAVASQPNGHEYQGPVKQLCDGTISIDLHDHDDHTYSGYGIYTRRGVYDVTYQNDRTGHLTDGVLY